MDPSLILIILFLVAPLIERLIRGSKPPEPPEQQPRPRQRPAPRAPGEHVPGPRAPAPRAERDDDEDAAAAMLPDDLWEVLTGERRTPRTQLPQRTGPQPTSQQQPATEYGSVGDPPPASFEDDVNDRSFEAELEPEFETDFDPDFEEAAYSAESVDIEPYVHRPPVREAPRVVSLEATSFDAEARHNRFHQRLDELAPPARPRRRKPTRAAGMLDDDDLRRAVIMTEVLGPPKGLQ